jgi:hypothetical protein
MKPSIRIAFIIGAILILLSAGHMQAQTQQRSTDPAVGRIPEGFQRLDASFWEGPWVFRGLGNERAIPRLHNNGGRQNEPIRFHFDNGTIGSLRVYAGPCLDRAVCGGPRESAVVLIAIPIGLTCLIQPGKLLRISIYGQRMESLTWCQSI